MVFSGIEQNIKELLEKIDFAYRYEILSNNYKDEPSFDDYDNAQVVRIVEKLGYNVKYFKSENFFSVVDSFENFDFKFNFSLKYAACEFIWYLKRGKTKIEGLGPWLLIYRSIKGDDSNVPLPCFSNYDTLEKILVEAFLMFEDFKNELLPNENES